MQNANNKRSHDKEIKKEKEKKRTKKSVIDWCSVNKALISQINWFMQNCTKQQMDKNPQKDALALSHENKSSLAF